MAANQSVKGGTHPGTTPARQMPGWRDTDVADIEAVLIWAYRYQQADLAARGSWVRPAKVSSLALLQIEAEGGGPVAPVCHPDADWVHAAVLRLSRLQSALVIHHGKMGTRPDWFPGARPVMAALLDGNGNPRRLYDASRHVIGHRVAPGVELGDGAVMVGWDMSVVDGQRDQYLVWRSALVSLCDALADTPIDHHQVLAPVAPARPWETA